MKVVILAGGYGTRLLEETMVKPKPMVEIGGRPILWHIMHTYAAYGFKEFILALGYKSEFIKEYFLNQWHGKHQIDGSLTINLASGDVQRHDVYKEDWIVHLMETGLDTSTGGRLMRLKPYLKDDTFMLTYGDGVANVDIKKLTEHHRGHGKHATVTAVRPPARFGVLEIDDKTQVVSSFGEKPQLSEGWINGGYFVLDPAVFDYLEDEQELFERTPLQRLASENQLVAYKHDGFWQCMDTLRDVRYLQELWASEKAPWKIW